MDTKYLDQLSYDEKDQTAHIGPGNGLKDVNDFLLEYGRLASHGDAPQVGVGGHVSPSYFSTLLLSIPQHAPQTHPTASPFPLQPIPLTDPLQYTIGGLGRISRQFGAACDNILSATVVLANGTITTASSTTNPDLFFALRGAGASFGIVTDFHIRTHPTPGTTIAFTYNITLGSSTAHATAFKQWQKLITSPTLPREFSTQFIALPGVSVITGFYYGTEKQFSSLNLDAQFSGFSAKDIRVVDPAVAVAHDISELGLKLFGDVPAHFYSKSLSFTNKTLLSDDAVDAMFNYLGDLDLTVLAVPWFVIFDLEGGAINDMPPDETAYAFRDTLFFLQSYAIDLLGAFRAETRRFLDGLNEVVIEQGEKEGLRGWGSYPGYVDPYLEGSREMYWGGNYGELRKVKRKWDSEQVFRNPQSVEPADA